MAVQEVVSSPTTAGGLEKLREVKVGIAGTVATLRLFRSDFVPGVGSVEADFEAAECDFDTYAPAAVTYGVQGIDGSGRPVMHSGDLEFQNVAGTSATPGGAVVGGAWLRTHQVGPPAVDVPLEFFQFPSPVNLSGALAVLTLDVVQVANNAESYLIVES